MSTVEYGSWPSPLSAADLAAGGIRIGGVAARGDEVWWSELRPAEAGRTVVVRSAAGVTVDVLPEPLSARNRVHEYGGGAWWLGAEAAYVANWDDQRLYRLEPAGALPGDTTPVPITPEPPGRGAWRYADGREHPDRTWLACVMERHGDGPEAVNLLVAIDLATPDAEPMEIGFDPATDPGGDAGRPDFVAGPRFSPDGAWLAWFRWSHPRMPWDGTELCVAPVTGTGTVGETTVLAGGPTEAVHGADWTSAGDLVFSSDRSGFWNLHRQPIGSLGGSTEAITTVVGAEIGWPQWVFGVRRWVETSDGQLIAAVTAEGADRLALVEPGGPGSELIEIATPYVDIEALVATDRGTVIVQGATPKSLVEITEIGLDGSTVAVHRPPDDVGLDPAWISVATSYRYRSGADGDREAQAYVYLPTAPGIEGPADRPPPLVVMGHGGPTAHSSPALSLRVQYWTTRGFAVADVNYGGSTGFGRDYRRLLDDAWGIVDVEDCIAVADRLAADGTVDGDRMAIRGGSAGGFTVLTALIISETFAAGTSLFGVADLEALAKETHKFESRYLDGLIGPYPERRDLYVERSPITHTDRLARPLLVLQGLEDEIVPPNQAEAIVAALDAKGIPHAYETYEGEQHGFRQEANIIRSYEAELWFYGRVFSFEPAEEIPAPERAVGL